MEKPLADREVTPILFSAKPLSKSFHRRLIFEDISFSLKERQSLAITGKNGSGKSTIAKIICGLLSPDKGSIQCSVAGKEISSEDLFNHIGFVSPYINLYDEFSGIENLVLIGNIRGIPVDKMSQADDLLKRFGLFDRRNDEVHGYSSGMKQRLKYAAALLHHPEILVLDEPTANLDAEGIGVVREAMRAQLQTGILIIATNDEDDLEFAGARIDLDRSRIIQKRT
ncbi:MAG TPA: ABC transporter ATP-binding protein [Bacteroidota bacterium]|nr:ABC transporter ATP-binding protein [Bacteroidota bacterium]